MAEVVNERAPLAWIDMMFTDDEVTAGVDGHGPGLDDREEGGIGWRSEVLHDRLDLQRALADAGGPYLLGRLRGKAADREFVFLIGETLCCFFMRHGFFFSDGG